MSVTHVTPLILFSFCFGTRKLVGASRNVLWNVLRLNNVCKRKQLYDENNLTSLICVYDEAKKIMFFCFIDNTIVTIVNSRNTLRLLFCAQKYFSSQGKLHSATEIEWLRTMLVHLTLQWNNPKRFLFIFPLLWIFHRHPASNFRFLSSHRNCGFRFDDRPFIDNFSSVHFNLGFVFSFIPQCCLYFENIFVMSSTIDLLNVIFNILKSISIQKVHNQCVDLFS